MVLFVRSCFFLLQLTVAKCCCILVVVVWSQLCWFGLRCSSVVSGCPFVFLAKNLRGTLTILAFGGAFFPFAPQLALGTVAFFYYFSFWWPEVPPLRLMRGFDFLGVPYKGGVLVADLNRTRLSSSEAEPTLAQPRYASLLLPASPSPC